MVDDARLLSYLLYVMTMSAAGKRLTTLRPYSIHTARVGTAGAGAGLDAARDMPFPVMLSANLERSREGIIFAFSRLFSTRAKMVSGTDPVLAS
jgi:hypothetical protein